LRERAESDPTLLEQQARAWEERNGAAFLRGYYETKGIEELLPPEGPDREAVRVAFEVDKALYELAYEQAYRPEWVPIPLAALWRLLSGPVEELLVGPFEPSGEEEADDGMSEDRRA
jgi:maltokinase